MGFNLSRILEFDCFTGAEVVAGRRGLECEVRLVNVMEVPDISNWVTESELILTTAYPFKEDPMELLTLIRQLHQKRVTGIAIKLSRYIKEIPKQVLECADHLGFPVISLPPNAQFDKIILETFSHIIHEDYFEIKTSGDFAKQLQEIALSGGTLTEIARALALWCGGEVIIKSPEGEMLGYCAAEDCKTGASGATYEKQVAFDGKVYAVITLNLRHNVTSLADLGQLDATIPSVIMIMLQSSLKTHIKKKEECLNDLILGRMVLTQKNIDQVRSLGVDLSSPYTVCVLRASHLKGESYQLLSDVVTRVLNAETETHGIRPITTKMQGCIVHLYFTAKLTLETLSHAYQRIIAGVGKEMPDIRLNVGIGRHAKEPGRINIGFLEAQKALHLGAQLSGRGGVYCFEDIVVESLLSGLPLDEELIDFVQSELKELIDYDRRRKKQLLVTLEQILSGESNKEIAEKMFIHPKTLAYRKLSIERILGEPLDTASKRMRLAIAVKLYRLNSARWAELFPVEDK